MKIREILNYIQVMNAYQTNNSIRKGNSRELYRHDLRKMAEADNIIAAAINSNNMICADMNALFLWTD